MKPSKAQLEFQDWEFGVFFHFGIRSFFKGHVDWDNRPMPASAFNPTAWDIDSWIRTASEAGARYTILTTKHHDGFALWPSKYTDYSVASTPWKDGKGDVVAEYVAACRKYGMKVGIYYSPAQWGGAITFSDAAAYDDYFINQIGELLTGYGKIDYLWFDGCGSVGHTYDAKRIIQFIRSTQPELLVFEMWDPDTRWIGNEDGYADMPCYNEVNDTSMLASDTVRFLPPECDFKMRSTWFDCEDNEDTLKELDELMGIYELSVGRGCNFLVNIGPDARGLLPEIDAARLLELGYAIRARYGTPVPGFSAPQREGEKSVSIMHEDFRVQYAHGVHGQLVNRLAIMEDLADGESIQSFKVYAHMPNSRDQRICVYMGESVGHKAICTFPTIRTGKLTLEVITSRGEFAIRMMTPYYEK